MSEKGKEAKREYGRNRYRNLKENAKQNFIFFIFWMSEKTLKFGDIVINKKEFHASEKPFALSFIDIDKIVISEKFKNNEKGFKYFIGYTDHSIIRPLCIVLRQMSGYTKDFDDGGKNLSFKIEDDDTF